MSIWYATQYVPCSLHTSHSKAQLLTSAMRCWHLSRPPLSSSASNGSPTALNGSRKQQQQEDLTKSARTELPNVMDTSERSFMLSIAYKMAHHSSELTNGSKCSQSAARLASPSISVTGTSMPAPAQRRLQLRHDGLSIMASIVSLILATIGPACKGIW